MTEHKPPATSFGEEAAAYARHRPGYPPAVFQALCDALPGRRDICVDLGAGSGQASIALAAHFNHVIAIEPDARMQAHMPGHANITPANKAAEDADFPPGSIDAVTCATSFHWMDQPRVIANVHRWLRPGGVFFPFLYGPFAAVGDAFPVIRSYRSTWSRYRDKRLGGNADYGAALRASGLFEEITSHSFDMQLSLSAKDAAALFLTTSYTLAHARATIGETAYAAQLAADLAAVCDTVALRIPLGGVIARKARAPQ